MVLLMAKNRYLGPDLFVTSLEALCVTGLSVSDHRLLGYQIRSRTGQDPGRFDP